ncbi:thioesterase family protein [Aeromicrobium sp.]|uniref:thioesterase family protein n=1 Tax=Aeromicrobium sp. TaxID=1871063 RepID=UPI003D6C226C
MSDLPTFDDVAALPAVFVEKVAADQIDENGHMNIRHYFEYGSGAVWKTTVALGVDDDYIDDRGMSFFTVEQHIRYFGEMRVGNRFTVHQRLLERSNRALHAMAFVLDRERSKLACTFELVYVHVDMAERESTDIPDDIAKALDRLITENDALGWAAPVCGAMGVRR